MTATTPPADRGSEALGRFAAAVVVLVSAGVLVAGPLVGVFGWLFDNFVLVTAASAMVLAASVVLGLRQQPGNRVLWVLLIASGFMALEVAAYLVAALALPVGLRDAPLLARTPAGVPVVARWSLWIAYSVWVAGLGTFLTLGMLWFPDGRLPSGRWWPVAWVAVAGMTLATLGFGLATYPTSGLDYGTASSSPGGLAGVLVSIGMPLTGLAVFASLGSLATRGRAARGDERQQLRWVGLGIVVLALALVPTVALSFFGYGYGPARWASLIAVPIALGGYGTALLKHGLYDIDVVLNRTLVFGTLAVFITGVYVAIVVGIGTALGDTSNTALAITATAVVAVVFEPVRHRVQHAANVFVYGQRATPYEVLAAMAGTDDDADSEELARRSAALLGEATGAARVTLWTRDDDHLVPGWSWPTDREGTAPVPIEQRDHPRIPDVDVDRPLVHDGDLIGAVSLVKQRGEPVRPADVRLVEEFAGQATALVANAQLTRQLRHRYVELVASRRRLVTAQNDARRRLERDVHDGAQQQLVALKVKLGLARRLADAEGADRVRDLIDDVVADADASVATLRDLARGIYPPLLEAEGLGPAITTHAQRLPLPVRVDFDGLGRHPRDVEAAVYFCVLEALQNTVKHAQARTVTVRLSNDDAHLTFEVADDGTGFDPAAARDGSGIQGMADRLEAIDGTLTVRGDESGTRVAGVVPLSGEPPPTP